MVLTTSYLARRMGYDGYSSRPAMMVMSYPTSVILHTHKKMLFLAPGSFTEFGQQFYRHL